MTSQAIHHENIIHDLQLKLDDDVNQAATMSAADLKPTRFQQFVYVIAEPLKHVLAINLLAGKQTTNAIIYVRTNFAADSLSEKLNRAGIIAESIHENKSQRTKMRTLMNFRNKSTSVVVVTESAASAIAVEVTTIINYDLPLSADTYGKRISCHKAAGMLKRLVSFCDISEQARLSNINRAFPGKIEMLDHDLS